MSSKEIPRTYILTKEPDAPSPPRPFPEKDTQTPPFPDLGAEDRIKGRRVGDPTK